MAKSLLPRTVDPVAAWLTLHMGERCRREHRAAKQAQLSRAEKVRRSLIVLKSTAPTRKLEGGQRAHALAREPPPCMLTHPCVLPHCIAHKLLPRPFGRHGARPRPQARTILAPQQAAVFCATRRSRQHPTSELSSISNLGSVRSTACMSSTRPSLMSGRLLSLSVLRFSAHPRDPSTHNETP